VCASVGCVKPGSHQQQCRNNLQLCREDEIPTQNSFDIVAVFWQRCANVASTLLPVWTGLKSASCWCSYFALVDGLRRAPSSFADLVYHSQIVYQFTPSDGQPRLVKFRLVPGRPCTQTGLLSETEDQLHPWDTKRPSTETRSRYYLRKEFVQRMEGLDAIRYVLQIQISDCLDEALWNPQLVRGLTLCQIVNVKYSLVQPILAHCSQNNYTDSGIRCQAG